MEKLLRRAHATVLRDSMAPWRTITLRLFRANAASADGHANSKMMIVSFVNCFDAITAVDELRRLDVVPILLVSTCGRWRWQPAGNVTGRLWRFRESFGVKGGMEEG